MFKVGNRVHHRNMKTALRTVTYIHRNGRIDVVADNGNRYNDRPASDYVLVETHFPLYSEEAAVKLLEERGYAVTPPPEPLKGQFVIIMTPSGNIHAIEKNRYDKGEYSLIPSGDTPLAIVDWTEGDGL